MLFAYIQRYQEHLILTVFPARCKGLSLTHCAKNDGGATRSNNRNFFVFYKGEAIAGIGLRLI